jgi:protein-disulfide isomerase
MFARAAKCKAAKALFTLLLGLALGSAAASADDARMAERFIGDPKAPVTIYAYASYTCSHCAEFETKVLPELKKKYIDTGKVRYIFRDYPLDGPSFKASALARCLPADQYASFANVLFANQAQWAFGKDPEGSLVRYAQLAGLTEASAKACMSDVKLLDAIMAVRKSATDKYDINATPTFIINDGAEIIRGAQSLEQFSAVIDKLLSKK